MEIGIKFVMTHLEIKKTNLPGFLNDFHIQTLIFFFPVSLSVQSFSLNEVHVDFKHYVQPKVTAGSKERA